MIPTTKTAPAKRTVLLSLCVCLSVALPAAAAQFARPASDINNSGGYSATEGTDLWDELDETTADDTTSQVTSGSNPAQSDGTGFEVKLGAVTDPQSSSGHILRIRHKKDGGKTGEAHWRLYQGSTAISPERSTIGLQNGNYTDGSAYTLTSAEANAITDYSDLRVRVWSIVSGGGSPTTVSYTWIEFEVPDAPAGSGKLFVITASD